MPDSLIAKPLKHDLPTAAESIKVECLPAKPASQTQTTRINDVLFQLHQDIAADLGAKKLAKIAAYSEQHFHRVFLQVTGENLNQYVRRTRMEHAANQLMFDPYRPISEIAETCGYQSLSSFSRLFKNNFSVSPGQWRKTVSTSTKKPYLEDPEIAAGWQKIQQLQLPVPELIELPPQRVAYVRHQGYGRSIRLAWQTLQAWAATEQRSFRQQWGLHHSNPLLVPLAQCRYVACLAIDQPLLRRGVVNQMVIPGGLHAAFYFSGKYGELLPWISKVQQQWLPQSGFRAKTTPAVVHYHRNHFLAQDEQFELTFYQPVGLY
ncbi:AraC family transcriptional regulator [Pelagibaculum spongiae]|uniref:AraC family transcriptional regulator n=1 Tax=Pelagibaculum spongiae TaxID=2080658 RepID=A0A2V1GU20_9GAMM|nr:helix-turn-helix domain-containing protein [Pelagibaculum spongiae]PVZ68157.1 AraC family transcriptional regulator [Pelagibaculum spongiae]